jgi:hypothetical protein
MMHYCGTCGKPQHSGQKCQPLTDDEQSAQDELDNDLIDYARSQWDGRSSGPRTEYD